MGSNVKRMDRDGTHQAQFNKNKTRIYKTQELCGICGLPVDKTLRFPNPMSKSIDHIIPIAKGGHPSDINNLQLAHLSCNRAKSDNLIGNGRLGSSGNKEKKAINNSFTDKINNRLLPLSTDWTEYKG